MANTLYDLGRQGFLDGDIDWSANDIRVILIDTADYTFSNAHQFLSSVPVAARVAVSAALAGKTSTSGVADADDLFFTAVAGDTCEALIIYQHTGVEATSRLIAYIDTANGLPVTPDGGDIGLTWSSTASKIFKL